MDEPTMRHGNRSSGPKNQNKGIEDIYWIPTVPIYYFEKPPPI